MAKIEQFKCDVCGRLRTEANHFWIVFPDPDTPGFWVLGPLPSNSEQRDETWRDFCGQDCALKFISAQMAGSKG